MVITVTLFLLDLTKMLWLMKINCVVDEFKSDCSKSFITIKPSVKCRRQFLDQVLLMYSAEYVFVTLTSLRERP